MTSALMNSLSGLVTPEMINRVASATGESPQGISKALPASFTPLLAGLAGKSHDSSAFRAIFNIISDPTNDGRALVNPSDLVGDVAAGRSTPMTDLGGKFISSLFDGQVGGITGALARMAGIQGSTSSSLLKVAAPLVMGVLGNKVRQGGLSASGLADLVSGEERDILADTPPLLKGALGLPGTIPAADEAPRSRPYGAVTTAARVPTRPRPSFKWVWPLVVLAALWGFWAWMRRPTPPPAPVAQAPVVQPVTPSAPPVTATPTQPLAAPDTRADVAEQQVAAGPALEFPAGSMEAQLVGALGRAGTADTSSWYNLDRVLFETGSSTVPAGAQDQLQNVATILKAHPDATILIGGYTDNVGREASNLKLSSERARSVMDELVALGVPASRMTAEGYGSARPTADNTSDEGRALNRRIALRLTGK